jgi:hypothetical protein
MPDRRFYKTADLLLKLDMSYRTFKRLNKTGKLPFLEELKPRLGQEARWRADLVDRYLAGQWETWGPDASRFFAHGRRRS